MMKLLLTVLCVTLTSLSQAAPNPIYGITAIFQNSGDINKKDDQGRKQGQWIIKGKDRPDEGYPTNGKIEEGTYADNRKNGFWTNYFKDGKTARLIGEFKDGRPKGAYTKMYKNGKVREQGTFVDGQQNGTFKTYHPNGKIAQEKTFNDKGLEEGIQKYYYPNGQVEFEFIKKNGVTTGQAIRYAEDGQIKEILTYAENGQVKNREIKELVVKPKTVVEGSGGPSGETGNMRGKTFLRDGYNKVYNDDEELWLDGKFQAGKLYDGKLYKYDADGILLKIEVWKNGKYHSDGQL